MKIRSALSRPLLAVVPAALAVALAPMLAGPALAAAPETRTGISPSATGSEGGTKGLCATNYPSLLPLITDLKSSWWSFSSTDFSWIGGIRTCGFIGTPAIMYACTGGQGSRTDLQAIGGTPSGPQQRRSFPVTCDGVRHEVPGATAWKGFTDQPFHIHWHTGKAKYQDGYLALR